MFSETFLPTYLGYFFGEGISPHRLILVKVFHRGSETVGIKFCHVSNSWLQGVLQRKGSHPPAPRGMRVKALRFHVLGRKELPESSLLT